EIGYTSQRPSEYATNILAAAIVEGYRGPVFIQGDHFQISHSRFTEDPVNEVQTVKELAKEAMKAGFYNIDVDTSTLVDLSQKTVPAQQEVNTKLSAEITHFIRMHQPEGITVSVGGEIGEVGGQNSNEKELRAYIEGFIQELAKLDEDSVGLSKISIQTGTSHGGVVMPDGSIAEVSVDFETLLLLSKIAREEYQMAGAVQHGASTLPQEAFGKFVEYQACEVHLATNFQNIFYTHAPDKIKAEIYSYLEENHANERKADMTDDQFYYKTRKRGIGAFKKQIWDLPAETKDKISAAWEEQFSDLFERLAIKDTKKYTEQIINGPMITPHLNDYLTELGEDQIQEDT
ncbi:MAG: class II fructose-bisphosphate aldolase, partial [Chloroflexota bacterium]